MKVFAIDFAKRRYFRKKVLRNEGICDRFCETKVFKKKIFAIDFAKRRYFRKKVLRNEGICDRFCEKIISKEGFAKRKYLRSILRNEDIFERRYCEMKVFAIDFAKRYYRKKVLRKEDICDRFCQKKIFSIGFAKKRKKSQKRKKTALMPLYLEYDASIFFFLFFLSFFFRFDPKTDHSYFTCHKKLYYSCSGSKTKKISSDVFISRIRSLYFLFLVLLKLFFFRFDPKTDHSYFTCHKKLYYSCSGSKTKKKISSDAFISRIRCLYFLFLVLLKLFFFVLTQKPTIHTLLVIKKCIIPALGQKRKKLSSDAFISRI